VRLRDDQRVVGQPGALHAGAADAVSDLESVTELDAIADIDACADFLAVRVAFRFCHAVAASLALIADRVFG